MLKSLQQLFNAHPISDTTREKHIDLTCAILLLEVAAADGKWQEEEIATITDILSAQFNLSVDDSKSLISNAKQQQQQAIDLYQFTRDINEHFNYSERVQLISKLWQVAFADNIIDPQEEHRIRKIADLLFVDHSDFIHGKVNAKANKS